MDVQYMVVYTFHCLPFLPTRSPRFNALMVALLVNYHVFHGWQSVFFSWEGFQKRAPPTHRIISRTFREKQTPNSIIHLFSGWIFMDFLGNKTSYWGAIQLFSVPWLRQKPPHGTPGCPTEVSKVHHRSSPFVMRRRGCAGVSGFWMTSFPPQVATDSNLYVYIYIHI